MNFREVKEANELIDEIKKLDSFTMDVQNPERTLTVSTNFNGVTIKKKHRIEILKVLFGMRRELEKLGVTEYDDND